MLYSTYYFGCCVIIVIEISAVCVCVYVLACVICNPAAIFRVLVYMTWEHVELCAHAYIYIRNVLCGNSFLSIYEYIGPQKKCVYYLKLHLYTLCARHRPTQRNNNNKKPSIYTVNSSHIGFKICERGWCGAHATTIVWIGAMHDRFFVCDMIIIIRWWRPCRYMDINMYIHGDYIFSGERFR